MPRVWSSEAAALFLVPSLFKVPQRWRFYLQSVLEYIEERSKKCDIECFRIVWDTLFWRNGALGSANLFQKRKALLSCDTRQLCGQISKLVCLITQFSSLGILLSSPNDCLFCWRFINHVLFTIKNILLIFVVFSFILHVFGNIQLRYLIFLIVHVKN